MVREGNRLGERKVALTIRELGLLSVKQCMHVTTQCPFRTVVIRTAVALFSHRSVALHCWHSHIWHSHSRLIRTVDPFALLAFALVSFALVSFALLSYTSIESQTKNGRITSVGAGQIKVIGAFGRQIIQKQNLGFWVKFVTEAIIRKTKIDKTCAFE